MIKEVRDKLFGLLGKDISYSFSRGYFNKKFKDLNLNEYKYQNFDIPIIDDFPNIFNIHKNVEGINVTIPYKEDVIQYLDELDETAKQIGAVNVINIQSDNSLKGYNTDSYGFENSIKPLLKEYHRKALILGTGGASKAISYVLKKNNIDFKFVSRNPTNQTQISYTELNKNIISNYKIIINCTPLGTSPNIELCPNIPYEFLSEQHLLYDLIYNPEITLFLSKGKETGATIKNGLEMLELQAEESWRIWNS